MTQILKLGDPQYAQSFKSGSPVDFDGFPQREQYLLSHVRGIDFLVHRHEVLTDFEAVARERVRLKNFIAGKAIDYVMVDNPLSALAIDGSVDAPILFDCIDWYDEVYLTEFGVNKRYYLLRFAMLDLLERANKVVAQSPVILESLERWGLKTKKTAVIPNGYDPRVFHPYTAEEVRTLKAEIEKRHSCSLLGKQVIVYSGRLSPWYDAVKNIAASIQENQIFLVVGDGPILQEIPAAANIVKCGLVSPENVPHYTACADVLVYPVDNDCSPIVLSEYLAMGKPIVMPKGRMQWLLKDGETGFFVDNNPYAWRRGISRALEVKEACGAKNLSIAADLTWDKLGARFSEFVRS